MQFTGKAPTTGLNSAKRDQHELARINALVVEALTHDPAFQIRTVDGQHWICPYLGILVPCAADWVVEAQRYLFQARPWLARRNSKPRPLFQVLENKWSAHLLATRDPGYLRFDAEGRWLDPDSGVATHLPRARTADDVRAIPDIARHLAARTTQEL